MTDVLLVDTNGTKLGNFTLDEAKKIALSRGKDLQLVSPENNVYKITDIGKQKYQKKQLKKKQSLQKRSHKIKEIQISPMIETHDLEVKSKHIREFLSKGLKTKVVMRFKGRQMHNTTSAEKKMSDFVNIFVGDELATVDKVPKFEGRNLIVYLTPVKE